MFEVIKNVINSKNFELREILYKIKVMYVEGDITEEQKEELDNMARENAKAENSYAPLQKQIDALAERVSKLESADKENTEDTEGTEEPEIIENYPEYVQPTGGHDAYKIGDKITYNGKKYECLIDNCVWTPDVYPQGWKLIEEPLILE